MVCFRSLRSPRIHLPAPLCSTPVTALHRSYGCSDSCAALQPPRRSPCFTHIAFRPFRLQSPDASRRPFHTLPFRASGISVLRVWASPLSCRLAIASGRNEFLIVRTGRSPPVAPHITFGRTVFTESFLRCCSYVWFRAGERLPGGDLHPSDDVRSQAHTKPLRGGSRDPKAPPEL